MHGVRWLEFPAAGPAVDLLGPIIQLSALAFALAFIVVADRFIKALFSLVSIVVGSIPLVGNLLSTGVTHAQQAISNALGHAISGIDSRIAITFHALARTLENAWNYQIGVFEHVWQIAQRINRLVTTGDVTRWFHDLTRLFHQTQATIARTVTQRITHTERIVKSVAQGVYPRLRSLEHEVTQTIPREIKSARSLAREAERGVARLWDRVRSLEAKVSSLDIAAAVAVALAALGLDWLGCRDGATRAGRSGCALWDDIGNLLGLATLVLAVEDFDKLVREMQQVEEIVITGVKDLVNL